MNSVFTCQIAKMNNLNCWASNDSGFHSKDPATARLAAIHA